MFPEGCSNRVSGNQLQEARIIRRSCIKDAPFEDQPSALVAYDVQGRNPERIDCIVLKLVRQTYANCGLIVKADDCLGQGRSYELNRRAFDSGQSNADAIFFLLSDGAASWSRRGKPVQS